MAIVWRDALGVGNGPIDDDHRHLILLINTLELILTTDRSVADLRAALDELGVYTQAHFAKEERIMIALRYAKYDRHKLAHGELIDQLKLADRLLQEFGAAIPTTTAHLPQEVRDSLGGLMRHWLLEHIVKEDLQLKPLLVDRPKDFAP